MAFSYLDDSTIFDAFNDSNKYMRPLFEPFQEFERVARNKPYPGIDKSYPKVTDGTTASVIQKTPRRIIQQLPTGIAHSDTNDWLTHVASFIFTNRIVINANAQYTMIQKCWNVISKALTYGSQPAYIPFINRGQYFGTDLTLPYIKDVFLEPGKLSDADSNYILMRSWYQPRDIKALINREQNLGKRAEGRGDKYESGWDLKALATIENSISQKDDLSTTPNERDKNNRSGGIPIIHAFQRGIQNSFYSYHMPSKTLLRTKTNKDPRGEIPIHYMYADTDGSNPLGRGFVELVGAMQNLMDAEVQMYQYNRALMLNPPIIKRGNWSKTQAKFAPNTIWDLGSSAENTAEALKIDSTAIAQFSNNYGLMKNQLMSLLSSPTSDISASVTGGSGQSKTQAGVQQQAAIANTDDNYIREQFESFYEKCAETMVNLYFAERSGTEDLQLDSETAAKINDIQEGLVSPDEKIRINYDTATEQLNFRIDPGTSDKKDDQEEIAKLNEVIQTIDGNPYSLQYLQQAGKNINFGEVYNQLFEKIGLKDIDKIITDVEKDEQGQPMSPPPMAMDKPKLDAKYQDLPPAAQVQFLRNAGINVSLQDVAQMQEADPNIRGQAADLNPANDPNSLENHPIIKLMSQLQIKFTDLPEDSKQEVLGIIGIPSQQLSPTGADTALAATDQQHQILSGMQPPAPMSSDQLLTAHTDNQQQQAQLQQQDQQADQQNQLQQQQMQQQADQAQQQGSASSSQSPSTSSGPSQPGLNSPQTRQPAQAQPPTPSNNLTAQDKAYMSELKKMGIPDAQIGQALAMLHHGYPAEDVLKMIQGAVRG